MVAKFVIDSYQFGQITINNKKYTNDLIILPNKIIDHWWRNKGHELQPKDLGKVVDSKVKTLIIGRGANGVMEVPQKTIDYLKENDIEPIIKKTTQAWQEYNQLAEQKNSVAAALHLTC